MRLYLRVSIFFYLFLIPCALYAQVSDIILPVDYGDNKNTVTTSFSIPELPKTSDSRVMLCA